MTTEIVGFILFIPVGIVYILAFFIVNALAFPCIAFISMTTNETICEGYKQLNEHLFDIIF